MEILTSYFQGCAWFFGLVKAFVWGNPWYLWENAHWTLFLFYILYLRLLIVGTWGVTLCFWDQMFIDKWHFPRFVGAIIEWLVIMSLFSLFYNLTWIPHAQYWKVLEKIVVAVYSDGLKWAWGYHWTVGVFYFFMVDALLGFLWPIHFTGLIHGDWALANVSWNYDRAALNQHNTFMQLVNIERAVNRLERRK